MHKQVQTIRDNEGYIVDPETWNHALAQQLAEEEGLTLDDNHWQVLNFMRQYWVDNHIAPDVRHVIKFLTGKRDFEKKQAKQHIFNLFPYGYVKQACKIAGMQRPRVWSTG